MKPVGPLMREHRLIERMLPVLQQFTERVSRREDVDPAYVSSLSDFLHIYVDRVHHGKEEDLLFKALAAKPLSSKHRSIMENLVRDHLRGRTLTKILDASGTRYAHGDAAAASDLLDALQGLMNLYPGHIDTEDHHFFLPCLAYLTADEQTALLDEFAEYDKQAMHGKYAGIMAGLESGLLSVKR